MAKRPPSDSQRSPQHRPRRPGSRLPRPTREELAAAAGKKIPDIHGPDMRVLLVGINPSLYSAAVGHHFARPGNRFWPALAAAGITPEELSPADDGRLVEFGYGLTNVVARATARADELSPEECRRGGQALLRKVRRWQPRCVAVLGATAFRTAFQQPQAAIGPQPKPLAGAAVWVLPNPSGLNAHYQLPQLAELYGQLRREFA